MADNILNSQLSDSIYNFLRLMKEGILRDLGKSSLTLLQLKALIVIDKKENTKMKEIAHHFHVETPTATSLVNKLCAAGLVSRKNDKSDRRLVRLELTNRGKNLLKKAKADYLKKITKTLSSLSDTEKQNFLKILEKIVRKNH